MSWWAFVGEWDEAIAVDDDEAHLSEVVPEWERARELLLERLRRFTPEECPRCAADAGAAIAKLLALEPGQVFEAEVEGEDFLLMSAEDPEGAPVSW